MFDTYIKNEEARRKPIDSNNILKTLICCVALKYPIVKSTKRKGKKPLILYDHNTNSINQKNTIRFISSESTKFVRGIKRTELPGDNAARYVSCRQIKYLLNKNSGRTSINSVILLIVIIKLLQYNIDSPEYRMHIDESYETGMIKTHPCSPDKILKDRPIPRVNCASFFLGQLYDKVVDNTFHIKPTQLYLANYLITTSDELDELVTDDVYDAIRTGHGYPNKQCEFKDITSNQMHDFPG